MISSDFCHWGQRFRYTYYDRSVGEIWQSIQKLDKQGMNLIETLNPSAFTEYLKKYGNTICGRHPIGVLLNVSSRLCLRLIRLGKYFLSSQNLKKILLNCFILLKGLLLLCRQLQPYRRQAMGIGCCSNFCSTPSPLAVTRRQIPRFPTLQLPLYLSKP